MYQDLGTANDLKLKTENRDLTRLKCGNRSVQHEVTHTQNTGGGGSARQDPDAMLKWQLPNKLLHAQILSLTHTFLTSQSTDMPTHFSLLAHTHFVCIILDPSVPPWYPFYWPSILLLMDRCAQQTCYKTVFYGPYKWLTVRAACCLFLQMHTFLFHY